jgi:hypothetical protein
MNWQWVLLTYKIEWCYKQGTWWPSGSAHLTRLICKACNQCLCGVWSRSQLAALDMLHCIKRFFGGITYRWFPPGTPHSSTIKNRKFLISKKIGCSEGGFRSRAEMKESGQNKCEIRMKKKWFKNEARQWKLEMTDPRQNCAVVTIVLPR